MEEKVVSLARYKAGAHGAGKTTSDKASAVKNLPDARYLWKLLDSNISISVWQGRNK